MLERLTVRSLLDGLPYLSNGNCLPGIAGGLPKQAREMSIRTHLVIRCLLPFFVFFAVGLGGISMGFAFLLPVLHRLGYTDVDWYNVIGIVGFLLAVYGSAASQVVFGSRVPAACPRCGANAYYEVVDQEKCFRCTKCRTVTHTGWTAWTGHDGSG